MMEITAEIRALIDKAAAGMELAGDEYIDPADGLIHCKKCGGQRLLKNGSAAWSVSNAERHRACKTAISMTTPLPTTTGKTH